MEGGKKQEEAEWRSEEQIREGLDAAAFSVIQRVLKGKQHFQSLIICYQIMCIKLKECSALRMSATFTGTVNLRRVKSLASLLF